MPARKKDKNETGADLASLGENASPSIAAFEMEYEARETPSPFPGDPPAWKKLASAMCQSDREEADEQLILSYLAYYHLLERALVRAGFVRAASGRKQVRPDWYS
jgi:hypothetical protein